MSAVSGKLKENVILIDADYVDAVALDIAGYFGRLLGKKIPPADLAEWLCCCALEAGQPEGNVQTQVILLHSADKSSLDNFIPSSFCQELDGQAFLDNRMGEFLISSICEENINQDAPLLQQSVQFILQSADVKKFTLVTNLHLYGEELTKILSLGGNPEVCLLTMPSENGADIKGVRTEVVAYGLMRAMGLTSEDLPD